MDFKKWFLAIAIGVVLLGLTLVATVTFLDKPEYEDFIPDGCPDYEYEPRVSPIDKEINQTIVDCSRKQNDAYDEVYDAYNEKASILMLIVGAIVLIIALALKKDAVSAGLAFGGILDLFVGTVRYWEDIHNYLRFIILAIVLAILIWIGYKKLK